MTFYFTTKPESLCVLLHTLPYSPVSQDEEGETLLCTSLGHFSENNKPFSISLNGFGCFAPRVIFVEPERSPALETLRMALLEHLRLQLNLRHERFEQQPFHPHVTMLTET